MKLLMTAAALLAGSCLIAVPAAKAQNTNMQRQEILAGKESTPIPAAVENKNFVQTHEILAGKESTPVHLITVPTAQTRNQGVLRGKESASVYLTLSGDVTASGNAFVSGRHEKVWAITNPDALREYAGQSITFLGTANPQTGRVTAVWIDGQFVGQTGTGNR